MIPDLINSKKCSGLKMNCTKTEAMWIGSCRNNTETSLALKWSKTVKALGVHFSYNNEESVQKNFYDKLRGIKSQKRLWSWRGLSRLVMSHLLRVYYFLKFYTSQLVSVLWPCCNKRDCDVHISRNLPSVKNLLIYWIT